MKYIARIPHIKATLVFSLFTFALSVNTAHAQVNYCFNPNTWTLPQNGKTAEPSSIIKMINRNAVTLLGEHHQNQQHHDWQYNVLTQLLENGMRFTIGVEMLSSSQQPALDAWLSHKLDDSTFLELVNWQDNWGVQFEFYRPIFELARRHKLPMAALNADKSLIQTIRQQGWENIPTEHRQGISDPAKPGRDYLRQLAVSFKRHRTSSDSETERRAFLTFVQQQLVWDRAMAERINHTLHQHRLPVIALMGSWHMINRHGVPYQLNALDIHEINIFVPWDEHLSCDELTPNFADAIYTPPLPQH